MAIAIITGASSGIGADFARELKDVSGVDGFWFVARRADRMEALRDELGVPAEIIPLDLATVEGIEGFRAHLFEKKPEVKFLVNAAGFGLFGAFMDMDLDRQLDSITLNGNAIDLATVSGGIALEAGMEYTLKLERNSASISYTLALA